MRYYLGALVGALITMSPAAAAEYKVQGSGTVTQVLGPLTASDAAPVGSMLSFSFRFDTAFASLYEQDDGYAVYDLPVSDFQANVGSYSFGDYIDCKHGFDRA